MLHSSEALTGPGGSASKTVLSHGAGCWQVHSSSSCRSFHSLSIFRTWWLESSRVIQEGKVKVTTSFRTSLQKSHLVVSVIAYCLNVSASSVWEGTKQRCEYQEARITRFGGSSWRLAATDTINISVLPNCNLRSFLSFAFSACFTFSHHLNFELERTSIACLSQKASWRPSPEVQCPHWTAKETNL